MCCSRSIAEHKSQVTHCRMPHSTCPEKGARPLPDWSGEILRVPVATSSTTAAAARAGVVELLCHVDRIYVRIRRDVFKSLNAYKDLKLGTCPVNQGTKAHYYLLYLLKTDCGFKLESKADNLFISVVLKYMPAGQVLRQMPFSVPLQCKYPRFFNSYKVGIHPKLQGGTVFKALQPKQNVILAALDASGNELPESKTYTLGQPMYFEAKMANATAKSGDQRMYINKCFMTASQNPNSNPKYTVIDNQGCMVDSKASKQSKFLLGASKMALKFSVAAFIFKDGVSTSTQMQQLYMHCDVSVGTLTPSPSLKACNYDPATKKWKELYVDDSVCICCESTCPSALPRASRKTISSPSWKVDLSGEDGFVDVEPRMKSLDADSISSEDPGMVEHKDFVNYWEDDY
ncbi:putative zona pellucida sperm-binding protein 3-like isoform 6 [Scophthalmus maximus]|uniref:Putative zona pellucida sperm-binding protein 3-like isoform 6 n=1 Tax=Scophthalmus maximus TaxID=52904 RepID=A0A2U9BRI3_SCOMX|nr:putative zona pellucida sperm-binding protein 3-like isoform 6 [Scophthalmus maximus]